MFEIPVYFILFTGISGLFLGIIVGLVFMNLELQNGLKIVIKAFVRITKKKWLRTQKTDTDIARVRRDQLFIALPSDQKDRLADRKAIDAVTELKNQLIRKFGDQIKAVYLFGSRARGDYDFDSDIDVGVFITESFDAQDILKQEMLYQTSKLLLKHGIYLQIRVFEDKTPIAMNNKGPDYLAYVVTSYGISV